MIQIDCQIVMRGNSMDSLLAIYFVLVKFCLM